MATAVPEGVFTLPVLSTVWSWVPFQHLHVASFDAGSNNQMNLSASFSAKIRCDDDGKSEKEFGTTFAVIWILCLCNL